MQVTKNVSIPSYMLEMSPEEARFLRDVLSRIDGDPSKSRRNIADKMAYSLDRAGVNQRIVVNDINRSDGLYFTNI